MFPGAPTIYIGLLNHPDLQKYDLSSIESCISGSASLPVEVQEQFEEVNGWKTCRRLWFNRNFTSDTCQS